MTSAALRSKRSFLLAVRTDEKSSQAVVRCDEKRRQYRAQALLSYR